MSSWDNIMHNGGHQPNGFSGWEQPVGFSGWEQPDGFTGWSQPEPRPEHNIMKRKWIWNNTSFILEILQSGELADFVIEVHQVQQQHDQYDDDDGKGLQKGCCSSSKIDGHANTAAAIQKEDFNVHKFILIANSEVFRAMFSHTDTKECRVSRIIITDSTIVAVRQMINYMYTGTLPYPDDCDYCDNMVAHPLLAIAHKYQIKPMMGFIESISANNLTFENVFDRLEVAELYGTEKLKSACSRMISENLKMLKRKPEWIEMQKNSPNLAKYIQQSAREYEKQCLRKKKEACPYNLRSGVKKGEKKGEEEAKSSVWVCESCVWGSGSSGGDPDSETADGDSETADWGDRHKFPGKEESTEKFPRIAICLSH